MTTRPRLQAQAQTPPAQAQTAVVPHSIPIRSLVYYTVGGSDTDYVSLLRESVCSLRRFHPPGSDVDVSVLCDATLEPTVRDELRDLDVRMHRTPPNDTAIQASRRKVECFQLIDDIEVYDRVLYLDCDIAVLGPLDPVLAPVLLPDTLYTVTDPADAADAGHYFALDSSTPEEIETIKREGTFNAGQFMFRPSAHMRRQFDEVQALIAAHPDSFYEQAAMNHHFNVSGRTDHTLLDPVVHLFASRSAAPPGRLLAHFCDVCLPGHQKLVCMKRCIAENTPH